VRSGGTNSNVEPPLKSIEPQGTIRFRSKVPIADLSAMTIRESIVAATRHLTADRGAWL
jgi:hypothetical protein